MERITSLWRKTCPGKLFAHKTNEKIVRFSIFVTRNTMNCIDVKKRWAEPVARVTKQINCEETLWELTDEEAGGGG
jgi:hypothetical protein